MPASNDFTCEFQYFRYHSPDYSVMVVRVLKVEKNDLFLDGSSLLPSVGNYITAVGTIPDIPLSRGAVISLSGHMVKHHKYGQQLKIENMQLPDPVDEDGIVAYLASGMIKGVGFSTAKKIVAKFQKDALRVLDEDPGRIKEVEGIGQKRAEKILSSWNEQRKTAKVFMALCSMGITILMAKKAIKTLGSDVVQKIRNNPYILCRLHGVGFQKADQIARNLDIGKDSPERIKAGLLYCLNQATYTEGHCFLPEYKLLEVAEVLLGVDCSVIENVLRAGCGNRDALFEAKQAISNQVYSVLDEQAVYVDGRVYLSRIYKAERYVSRRISQLAYKKTVLSGLDVEIEAAMKISGCNLSNEQTDAVRMALLHSRISVICGLPGVGKTTTVKAIIGILDALGKSYILCAPTGKAARRMEEQTGCKANTIHRVLQVQRDGSFARNEKNPLESEFIIVDEVSMIDLLLFESLLKAVSGQIILIGDPNQLPAIGPGSVLKDIIDKALAPVKQLRQIQRQAENSSIVKAAHMIYAGQAPRKIHSAKDYFFIKEEDPEKIRDLIVDIVCANEKYRPDQIQVLSPMKRGPIGVIDLNVFIQKRLTRRDNNQGLKIVEGREFFIGDRVIQIENNYEKDIYNGEIGYVVQISEDHEISVQYADRTLVYEEDEIEQLSLAYALTVHKAQGSEFPVVVIPLSTQHYVMLFRNLLYTAVTRAKEMLIIVGTEKAANIAVRNNKMQQRYTDIGFAVSEGPRKEGSLPNDTGAIVKGISSF